MSNCRLFGFQNEAESKTLFILQSRLNLHLIIWLKLSHNIHNDPNNKCGSSCSAEKATVRIWNLINSLKVFGLVRVVVHFVGIKLHNINFLFDSPRPKNKWFYVRTSMRGKMDLDIRSVQLSSAWCRAVEDLSCFTLNPGALRFQMSVKFKFWESYRLKKVMVCKDALTWTWF